MRTLVRHQISRYMYRVVAKPFFFKRDPEDVHDRMTRLGTTLGNNPLSRVLAKAFFSYAHPSLEQTIHGVTFANPVGLAAGFDKNAELTQVLPSVGFGFEEIGSVTGEACVGNPKPRLWRLPESSSLVVYYGLKNDGAEAIAKRLATKKFTFPIGVSIAKTNNEATVEQDKGIADYAKAFSELESIGDYITVNISCPNAYGGQPFTDPDSLDALLTKLDTIETDKPIFVKLSPDLGTDQIDALIQVMDNHRVHGIICANLTKRRENNRIVERDIPKKGGLSGKVVEGLSDDLIKHVYRTTSGKYTIVGVGGIFTAEDAYTKIKAGASLVQLITGMVFQGPQVVGEINHGLVQLLEKDGYTSIAQAVGADVDLD